MTLKLSESPAVSIREIDLTGTVPAVTSTTGAIVGDFNWGPVNTPVLVGNEAELVAVFGKPTTGAFAGDFLAASYFLKYSSSLFVSRISNGAYATQTPFTAKYPGLLGSDLEVSVCGPVDAGDVDAATNEWDNWGYASQFSSAPVGVERHVIVLLDNVVVETFEYVSSVVGATTDNGTNNYLVDVINGRSSWVTVSGMPGNYDFDFAGGTNGTALTSSNYASGFDVYANKESIQVDFLIAPAGGQTTPTDIHTAMNAIAAARKDCVAVVSPDEASVVSGDMSSYVTTLNENSSYLIVDGNWIKVYNKYLDKYETLPAASSTAGIMAASDAVSAPWFSPAGSRRGQYLGVTELVLNPSKTQRDAMYKLGVNPIVSMPGQGVMLFGDKTHLARPSAFDRINVRRLFLTIERAISQAGENVMFEFNDEFTRAEFVNIVEPFLREIQGRRGITDFRVVCDATNNTAEVVDRNEFIATCFIKPARSINYVTLNFVAVRTGVEFEEVVGTV